MIFDLLHGHNVSFLEVRVKTMDPSQNQPTNQTPQVSIEPTTQHGPSRLLWLLLGLLFAVFVFLLVVLIRNNSLVSQLPQPGQTLVIRPSPTPTLTDEQEVSGIDVGSVEADLQEVKTDLQGL